MSKKCVVNRNDNGDITSVEVVNLSYTPNTDNIKFDINNENQSDIDVSEAIKLNNGNPLNLAPNGKPSILYNTYKEMGYSEEEAIKLVSEVYSERFRNFFGDWQNDPENSSKVVDENGQPKIVWSGHVSSTITSNINGAQFQGYRIYGNEYNSFKQDGEKPQDYRFSNTALFVEDKKLALTYSTGIDAFNTSESFMQKYAPKDSFLEPVFLNIRKYEEVEEVSNKIIPRIDSSIEEGIDGFYGGNRAPYKDFKTWAILDENQVLNAKSPEYINNDIILLNNVVKVLSNKGLTSDVYLMTNDEIVEKLKQLGISENIARELVLKHGSPHKFDKFSTEFMGTGEGAQAFGWGLYFTDSESIARNYAKTLAKGVDFSFGRPNTYDEAKALVYSAMAWKLIDSEVGTLVSTAYYSEANFINGNPLNKEIKKEDVIDYIKNNRITEEEVKIKAIEFLNKDYKVSRNLYKVSLHKGKTPDQYTWLEWDKPVSQEVFKKINDLAISKNDVIIKMLSEGINTKNIEGSALYKNLSRQLGSDKAASLFLLEAGIDGIKYPAESISRGTTSDTARGFNYVVFDDNAITIEDKIQFMYNGKGVIYGAKLPDGTIYINPDFVNANTAIHEFSHLWEQLMPTTWKKGIEIFKQTPAGKKIYNQLKNEGNYSNLTDNELWSEALNTHIGNYGEWKLSNSQTKMGELVSWLKGLFNKIGNYFGFKLNPETNLEQFTKSVVKDLLGGKPIVAENQVSPNEQVQYSFLTENDYDANGNIKPEVLAEIQAEREAIKSEAQANGTFMKAPNGKATNLNEAQWIDVRTKRFKDWFGDIFLNRQQIENNFEQIVTNLNIKVKCQ